MVWSKWKISPAKKLNSICIWESRDGRWVSPCRVIHTYLNYSGSAYTILVNGKPAAFTLDNGYAVINREWKKDDVVELNLPMEVRRWWPSGSEGGCQSRCLWTRPLVFCVEHSDNNGKAFNFFLPDNVPIKLSSTKIYCGTQVIKTDVPVVITSPTAWRSRLKLGALQPFRIFMGTIVGRGKCVVLATTEGYRYKARGLGNSKFHVQDSRFGLFESWITLSLSLNIPQ